MDTFEKIIKEIKTDTVTSVKTPMWYEGEQPYSGTETESVKFQCLIVIY